MKIRVAANSDAAVWDVFVDEHDGMFHQYFGWKYAYEQSGQQLIPLIIENEQSQLLGIFSLVKEVHTTYSLLYSWGFKGIIFKAGLSPAEKREITFALMKYIDDNYSRGCSTFRISDQLPLGYKEDIDPALVENGFRVRNDPKTGLPCSHIIPLAPPFEETIWKQLWPHKLRQTLNKVERSGVKVIHDQDLKYLDEYTNMVIINYKRHKDRPPTRDFIQTTFKVFRDKIKLYVALDQDKPVAILSCIYTRSTCYLWEIGSYTKDTNHVNKYVFKIAIEDACNRGYKYADFLGANTPGLSIIKTRFGTQQTPIIEYEKRYSAIRVLLNYTPVMIKNILFERKHLWENRAAIWDKIIHW